MTSNGLRHGDPEPSRNDKYGFDKYRWPAGPRWPSGLEIHIYDDGRVKVGGWHTSVAVLDVSSYRTAAATPAVTSSRDSSPHREMIAGKANEIRHPPPVAAMAGSLPHCDTPSEDLRRRVGPGGYGCGP